MNSPSPEHAAHEHHHAMPHAAEGSGDAQGPPWTTERAGHGDGGAHDQHEGHSVVSHDRVLRVMIVTDSVGSFVEWIER